MTTRFYPLLWLGLLLVSCDKSPKTPAAPDKEAPTPRVTKAHRTAAEELPATRDQLRAALEKASEIDTPAERNQALAEAVWDALELDPELAQEGFKKLAAGSEEKNQLIQHFAMRLAEQNVDEAFQWASALETEEEKSLAFGNIALVLSENEPERAAHLLSESGVAGRDLDVAVVQVAQRWAAESPSAAAAWIVLFDEGEARSAGLKAVVSIWAKDDLQGALTWIAAIQDQTIHEEAVLGMAETILEQPDDRQDELLQLTPAEVRSRFEKLKVEAAAQ